MRFFILMLLVSLCGVNKEVTYLIPGGENIGVEVKANGVIFDIEPNSSKVNSIIRVKF